MVDLPSTDCDFLVTETHWAIMTIAQEARSEPFIGKVAVAEVIRNRMKQRYFSDGTIIDTVLRPYQFSGWNTNDSNRIVCARLKLSDKVTQDCIKAWEVSESTNHTNNAVNYYAQYIAPPKWAYGSDLIKTVQIGRHLFYKRK